MNQCRRKKMEVQSRRGSITARVERLIRYDVRRTTTTVVQRWNYAGSHASEPSAGGNKTLLYLRHADFYFFIFRAFCDNEQIDFLVSRSPTWKRKPREKLHGDVTGGLIRRSERFVVGSETAKTNLWLIANKRSARASADNERTNDTVTSKTGKEPPKEATMRCTKFIKPSAKAPHPRQSSFSQDKSNKRSICHLPTLNAFASTMAR